jgi:HSP20 family protein
VTAELPGVDEKDLDITLANGMLTVRGEKRSERDEQDKDKNWHVVERSYGSFSLRGPLQGYAIGAAQRPVYRTAALNEALSSVPSGVRSARDSFRYQIE